MAKESPHQYLHKIRKRTAYPKLRSNVDILAKTAYGFGGVFVVLWFVNLFSSLSNESPAPGGGTSVFGTLVLNAIFICLWFIGVYFLKCIIDLLCDLVDSYINKNRRRSSSTKEQEDREE